MKSYNRRKKNKFNNNTETVPPERYKKWAKFMFFGEDTRILTRFSKTPR
jgi:hypothetical protein